MAVISQEIISKLSKRTITRQEMLKIEKLISEGSDRNDALIAVLGKASDG